MTTILKLIASGFGLWAVWLLWPESVAPVCWSRCRDGLGSAGVFVGLGGALLGSRLVIF